MIDVPTAVGSAAAFLTTASYVPQLKKCWDTGSAEDLSLAMVLTLMTGLSLWIAYGVFQNDLVVIGANSAGMSLLAGILFFKLRDMRRRTR